jgi:mycothiol synthase
MALAADIRLRRPTGSGEDAVLVLMLLTACQIADTGRSDRELVDVEEQWAQPGADLERDAWVALDPGDDAIGYAFVHDGRAEARVHPRARGRGLGTRLRDLAEARALELRMPELLQVVAGGNRPAERLLEDGGYTPVHHAWRMERPLDVAPAPPRWPSGVTMHALDGDGDAADVLALLERSGATLADGRPLALDRFHAEHLAVELLDPELCVLARRGERLVGVAICETWDESDGSIVQLSVDRDERDRGIGHALLLAALARLRERGLDTAVLHVGADEPTPPSVYADVGMRPVWRQTSWRKRLR